MERVAEWSHDVRKTTRRQDSLDLANHSRWTSHVFENRVTLDALEQARSKRKVVGIRYHVHTGNREQVDVNVTFNDRTSAPDVKIPAAKWNVKPLSGVHHKRLRGRKEPIQSVAPVMRCSASI